ncbi:MAG: hypothetical protein KF718_16485 [Polyangiaceae bacterium]|nr:hypothetical protein [Polyangiaceae bacterium]
MQRRWVPIAALVVLAASGLWLASPSAPESRLERELVGLAEAVSAAPGEHAESRLRMALGSWLSPQTTGTWDGRTVVGTGPLLDAAGEALHDRAIVALEAVKIERYGDETTLRAVVSLADSQRGDLHRRRRSARIVLRPRDTGWEILRFELSPVLSEEPEARP